MKSGTIFTLTGDVWGYDITLFNYYKEEEILLEPETKFIVDSVLPPVNDIIYITCKVLKSPLVFDSEGANSNPLYINNNVPRNNNIPNVNDYIVQIEAEIKKDNISSYIRNIGYLCNINTKNIYALITAKKIESLNEINKLIISIDNKKKIELDMKKNRYMYTNDKLDITIIEILKQDNINRFIEIDRFIDSKDYINENVEAYFYQNEIFLNKMDGIVIKKNNNNYICNIKSINNGIIILNSNSQLIGIIKENKINNINNLVEFIPMNIIINNINYIKCTYEIKNEKINRNIQILNNKYYYDKCIENQEIMKKINVITNGKINSNTFTYEFNQEGLHEIYITSNYLISDMSGMFLGCSSLKKITFAYYNTSQVTNMSSMFYGCSSLMELDFSSFNTNQVKDMSSMFYKCSSLKEISLSSFNTSQVTNMSYMFSNCSSIKQINLSSFNTSQVTNMSDMFSDCFSLEQIYFPASFNTDQVTNMSGMFSNCSSLKELNLLSFNTSQVIYMNWMFSRCSSLEKLNLSSSFNTNQATDMSGMFYECSSLKKLNLSSFNTNQITNISSMFEGCSLDIDNCKDERIMKQLKDSNVCCIII